MLYLKASSEIEAMDEYEGQKGMFFKTFALSDKRNKNGWRVTWDSIKRKIATFTINKRPGIEYVKCENSVCDLDHTDGVTKEQSIMVQEPFRKSTLVDYTLDEATHKAYFIHKTEDAEFYEKVKTGQIKYVSPSIWPTPGAYDILGRTERGMLKIDVYDWEGLHDAFVNNPAFGDEAKITAVCEGEGCHMRLLSAKEMQASDLDPLKQVSILVRHKDKLHFVSVSKEAAQKIQALYDTGNAVDEKAITDVLKQNNSFSACSCSAIQMDQKEHDEKMAAMKKAAEEKEKEKDEKIKELESKLQAHATAAKASLVAALKAMSDEDGKEYVKSLKASAKDAKIIDEAVAEAAALKAKDESAKPKENPRITKLEAKLAEPMIEKMLSARKAKGATEEEIAAFEKSLRAKSYDAIEEQYNNEQILMKDLVAKEEEPEKIHFPFNGSTQEAGAFSAKSLEEVFGEVSS